VSSDEESLIARAQRGDTGAFETLYHANANRLFTLCLRMTGDRARATELLQDVFVRIWERLGTYRGDAAFSTWAHRLAVNTILESERKDARREARVTYDERPDIGGPSDGIDTRIDLDTAMAKLTPALRRVFVLHDMEGYQHNEIARMTGTAEGTLRAQLHHARQRLIEVLREAS